MAVSILLRLTVPFTWSMVKQMAGAAILLSSGIYCMGNCVERHKQHRNKQYYKWQIFFIHHVSSIFRPLSNQSERSDHPLLLNLCLEPGIHNRGGHQTGKTKNCLQQQHGG